MRMRYRELIGMRVVEGKHSLGRARSLIAERDDEDLRVTGIEVGTRSLFSRIGAGIPGNVISWQDVTSIDRHIHVRLRHTRED